MSLFSYIKSHLSILDIVSEYVTLKQAGSYWKGSCPFHNETDASFTVSPDKGIYYCFGCHAGGDVISFIAQSENLQQIEAAHHIIERFNLTVPEELLKKNAGAAARNEKKRDYYSLCQQVASWAHENLKASSYARDYLERRGINAAQIDYFQIGYFKGGTRAINLFIKAMAAQNILLKDILEAGILVQGKSVVYSPFEERIIFPIKNSIGQYCGFGGRVFKAGDERAKYYNSRESVGFSKGKLLFGLHQAKKDMQRAGHAFLVEGYTDCVAMAQAGYYNTVATLGTACTLDHLQQLARFIKMLYVLYDGDAAGRKAILRLTQLCWEVNLELRVIQLPHGDDPATYLEKHSSLDDLIEQAPDIFTFFVVQQSSDFVHKTLSEKLELTEKIVAIIARIDDPFKQDLLVQQAAGSMHVPFDSLKQKVAGARGSALHRTRQASSPASEQAAERLEPKAKLEEKIVAFVVNSLHGDQVAHVEPEIKACFSPISAQIIDKVESFCKTGQTAGRFDRFVDTLPEEQRKWVLRICIIYQGLLQSEFDHYIKLFAKQNWKQIVQTLRSAIIQAKADHDTDKLATLMREFAQLKSTMRNKGLV